MERGRIDPDLYLYVVENIGQGDPAAFTLKVLHGDRLRRLLDRAVARTSHEVRWPVPKYDVSPTGLDVE